MNKKISEINLNPDYTSASYTLHKRNALSTGAPNMSADQNFARNQMQRVNKNQKIEEEELEVDEFVEDIAVIKEFFDSTMVDRFLGGLKTTAMSVPIAGDIFAFGKFMYTISKLRKASRKFTKKLGRITGVDLGNDFLEPEGSLSDERVLDDNLAEAINRITNLSDYPELKVTTHDIKNLDAKFAMMCKYVKDGIMEFIGFADIAFGQKGFFVNMGINFITFSELPDYLSGEYANIINDMSLKAKTKEGKAHSDLLGFFGNFLYSISYPLRKIGDFLGNIDLIINPKKLARLSKVHNALKQYRDVDTSEEYFQAGLKPVPGSQYYYYMRDVKDDLIGKSVLDTAAKGLPPTQLKLENFLKKNKNYLSSDISLAELYEDEEELDDPVEEHMIAGASTPMGTKSNGSIESSKEREARLKSANIYREHLQVMQSWKHMTSGRIK